MAQIGMVGLAVMGSNLARNIESKGYSVAVYDIDKDAEQRFMAAYGSGAFEAVQSLGELAQKLETPRMIVMMVRAGEPVDRLIEEILPYLAEGDILIDGGNSDFHDTRRRQKMLNEKKIRYIGMGVSGGEQGALHGPSLMPGGDRDAWEGVKHILTAIAAKAPDGTPCCAYLGPDGAGHLTKTVHNGIEYGEMQLICEAYQMMCDGMGMKQEDMAETFRTWNTGMLGGYLISITVDILKYRENGRYLLPQILDVAGQKGTGKWTVIEAASSGVPATITAEALFARFLSNKKEERKRAAQLFPAPELAAMPGAALIEEIRSALLASKIILYAQGCMILAEGAGTYGWEFDLRTALRLWRGGCIIRSGMLDGLIEAFGERKLRNPMLAPEFTKRLNEAVPSLRKIVAEGAARGIPLPAMSSALSFFDGYRSGKLSANLLQAQRDYFGAHGYALEDAPDTPRHTDWTGKGGKITSGTYNA
ncbi:decarboxylating NADP(+)-dependent phosphogluconate dehydrogenase [Christensenella tenuis]|uniref:6-phosphogluconate dehydrogenase, decarboxylating n=1 Tax=Christensenella tenuis TaxID=2763033 RepID=A0ABR7ECP6_9FIRM|nr:decarboxylating NADP(+)-dependent phosphogluconate dehydrogenase [Christensenella tenuis]MBC5647408.1 decarboxylating NADP(+)-dependent phosphogluconate dehydrogenase [Christensenella tenuis]